MLKIKLILYSHENDKFQLRILQWLNVRKVDVQRKRWHVKLAFKINVNFKLDRCNDIWKLFPCVSSWTSKDQQFVWKILQQTWEAFDILYSRFVRELLWIRELICGKCSIVLLLKKWRNFEDYNQSWNWKQTMICEICAIKITHTSKLYWWNDISKMLHCACSRRLRELKLCFVFVFEKVKVL